MNVSYLKNKNIHFVECENWHDAYGYEKTEMKEDIVNYIEKLQKENKRLNGAIQTYNILLKVNVEENKQLKDNWNRLFQYFLKKYNCGYEKLYIEDIINKMQELEGSDNNVKD